MLNPKYEDAYNNRGVARTKLNDLDGGIADLTHALVLNPKDDIAYHNRGNAKGLAGDLNGAAADFNRALALNPKRPDTYISRGRTKADRGDLNGAIADYNQASKFNGKFTCLACHGRGNAFYSARKWVDALREYRRCQSAKCEQEYDRLFVWLLRSRLGEREAANNELAGYYKTAREGWVSKIAAYLLGNLSQADYVAQAASSNSMTDLGQHCEAWFYIGMKKLIAGDKPAAADSFRKCLATKQRGFTEYRFAKAELKGLGQ